MKAVLDVATAPWGVMVERVEVMMMMMIVIMMMIVFMMRVMMMIMLATIAMG